MYTEKNPAVNQYNDLMSLLIKCLPRKINASNHKSTANNRENRNRDRMEVLKNFKFMQFNSTFRVSIMIFDIDFIDGVEASKVFSLHEMSVEIERITHHWPTYILQTSKGYHFAFHLKNQVFLNNDKSKKYLVNIKDAIIEALGCDKIASTRLYGIWRNPLTHNFWYSDFKDYELKDFNHLVKYEKRKFPSTTTKSKLSISFNQLFESQRNTTLFLFGVNYGLDNPLSTDNELAHYLEDVNKHARPPLESKEVLAIAKSVNKYKNAGKLFKPKVKERDINLGVMNFEKMAYLPYKEYLNETKRRQSLSAERTNSLPTAKKSKQIAIAKAQKVKIKHVRSKMLSLIKQAIIVLKKLDMKLSYVNIARESKLDRRTVKKYIEMEKLL